MLLRLGRIEDALASYDHAIRHDPSHAEAHYNRGNALVVRKQYDEALASYDRAIALKENYPGAMLARGQALVALDRKSEAIAALRLAAANGADHDHVTYLLAASNFTTRVFS